MIYWKMSQTNQKRKKRGKSPKSNYSLCLDSITIIDICRSSFLQFNRRNKNKNNRDEDDDDEDNIDDDEDAEDEKKQRNAEKDDQVYGDNNRYHNNPLSKDMQRCQSIDKILSQALPNLKIKEKQSADSEKNKILDNNQ